MEFNDYYENFPGSDDKPAKKKSSAGAFIITAVVFLLLGALITVLIMPTLLDLQQPGSSPGLVEGTAPTPENEPSEIPTPVPTSRPLAEFDGEVPDIVDSVNPIPDIVEAVSPSVVGVINYSRAYLNTPSMVEEIQGTGTGFIISTEGIIVTNAHVVQGASSVGVVFEDGEEIIAEIMGLDRTSDIAVLKVERQGIKAVKLGDSDKIRVGEFTIAIGDPTGRELSGTTTFGIISALNRSVNIDGRTQEYIQTDAAINPGNSGGPLLNMKGEVIGITSAKTVTASYDEFGNAISAEGLGFAVPISKARPIIEQLITVGYIQRPGIGISIIEVTERQAAEWQCPVGVSVVTVTKDGPGHKAGLKVNDIIVECNGVKIVSQDEFVKMIQSMKIGDTVKITYWREGEYYDTELVIGDLNSMSNEAVEEQKPEFRW
ncbi:MAG: putative serine protease HhoB precursor [Firmicutes bacterium ADurb.Bin182]|nr:MAG: putative serine protease HhoB precursor [Firmicutes bacterium ADurb.Bin182]